MKLFSNYFFRWFIVGFAFGLLASVSYLLIEGPMSVFYPMWARLLGYPGVVVGEWHYHHFGSFQRSEIFGCLTIGISYGLIFLAIGILVRKFRKSR